MVFATSVVRRPSPGHATVYSGGHVATGQPGWVRVPSPVWPPGLELLRSEAAGEVQTPLAGAGAGRLQIGDRVWFRHAKAGEACERFDRIHLVRGGELRGAPVPTYRGEGMNWMSRRSEVAAAWTNWSRTVSSRPSAVLTPTDVAQIQRLVTEAASRRAPIKAVGAGHSFSPVAATDGVQLRLDALSGPPVDRPRGGSGHGGCRHPSGGPQPGPRRVRAGAAQLGRHRPADHRRSPRDRHPRQR